ncbi:hypothetical protein CRG98_032785 [Punica granatum]|uniref:Uncharacterized protein n=1 Tax=Punica granatum TaxID=22663 RepID=A0A2I0IS71_PUNGR|nr:hypothetical protein CRG98_032785 [Punica granatum]
MRGRIRQGEEIIRCSGERAVQPDQGGRELCTVKAKQRATSGCTLRLRAKSYIINIPVSAFHFGPPTLESHQRVPNYDPPELT